MTKRIIVKERYSSFGGMKIVLIFKSPVPLQQSVNRLEKMGISQARVLNTCNSNMGGIDHRD